MSDAPGELGHLPYRDRVASQMATLRAVLPQMLRAEEWRWVARWQALLLEGQGSLHSVGDTEGVLDPTRASPMPIEEGLEALILLYDCAWGTWRTLRPACAEPPPLVRVQPLVRRVGSDLWRSRALHLSPSEYLRLGQRISVSSLTEVWGPWYLQHPLTLRAWVDLILSAPRRAAEGVAAQQVALRACEVERDWELALEVAERAVAAAASGYSDLLWVLERSGRSADLPAVARRILEDPRMMGPAQRQRARRILAGG